MGNNKKKRSQNENLYGWFPDPMAVTWSEKYSETLNKFWNLLPNTIGKLLATISIFLVGISVNGDWVNIFVHIARQFGYTSRQENSRKDVSFKWSEISLESLGLQDFWSGFLHWYFYVRRRDRAEDWKCQPKKWLSPELERHEIILGSLTLFLNASTSGLLACYIANGGYSTVYYNVADYGWLWFFLQWPVIFIYQDYITYWMHRIYHTPFLYRNFHKLHHKYKQPTAFSVTAIHPVEALHIQLMYILPLFIIPTHWFPFYVVALYTYYHGIIDHSGVNFKAYWWQPWQPDAIFHDNHHQYFHVNFAFNIGYWDKLHGTYRRKDRVYTEDIFYGKGKRIDEVSAEELKADLKERESENPLAYRDNKMEFKLSNRELKAMKRPKK
ncbi:delta(7)-sterol 5(6)-desaturase erg31-like isoform X2 [Tribolium madens]|uniref:delta(7)-sterol 5(6)-desaturase erg31-like isoform X2 n=1 Tax=Tribolium madens TaxID=41895 RepID=UPI001CF730FB|nr:delta(7)-sterol 5(6)-desaturase erg31-like isoform X2 [Tribolium madens]